MKKINDTKIEEVESKKILSHLKSIGPGLTSGAADDDPSGIATYSQAGAAYGFKFLWLAIFTFPLMALIQEMCARIALVTGRGLASNIKIHFSRKLLYIATILLVISNTFNIGADLSAMAEVSNLIIPSIPQWFYLLLVGAVCILLEVFVSYKKYSVFLKWLSLALLSYVLTGFVVHFDIKELIYNTFVPSFHFGKEGIMLLTAVLGTTISPYLFFWQTSQEVEEEISRGETTMKERKIDGPNRITDMRWDVWFGMFFSNLVMFFIIAVCAGTLFKNGITDIQSAADAAAALKPIAGNTAYLLFALGVIGTGLLALPVLAASSAYAVSETFGWKEGLYKKLRQARAFYAIIFFSILAGFCLRFLGISPIKSLIYSAVLNGLISPIIIFFIVVLAGNKKIMGDKVNGLLANSVGWLLAILMSIGGVITIANLFF